MSSNTNQKLNKGSAQETLQMIECGNLDLNFPIKYGILLLGKTKAGKTTTAHYLMHQILKGGYNDDYMVVYKVDKGDNKFAAAKIGDKERVSETQIPNFFDFMEGNQKFYLIDCPGYLDSFGCFRIISNRFFHFQVFSKVENIKFIITFSWNNMENMADLMKITFNQFLSGFSNHQEILQQLINATSVMITNVPQQIDLKILRQRYAGTPTNIGSQLQQVYIKLKKQLLDKNRIFMFKKAKLGATCDYQNQTLKQINSSTKFWKRQKNKEQQVDMKNIKISIANYLDRDKSQFSKQLPEFQVFYKKHFKADLENAASVLKELMKDNLQGQQSFQFVNKIKNIIIQKRNWRKSEECKSNYLYQKYKDKRNKLKQQLFKPVRLVNFQNSQNSVNSSQLPLWLLKISASISIQKQAQKIARVHFNQSASFQNLLQKSKALKLILQILISLAKCKKQKQSQLKNQYVFQFAYQIFNVIQVSNKLFRLIKTTTTTDAYNQTVQNLNSGMSFILDSYPSDFSDLFLSTVEKSTKEIFLQIYNKIKIQQNLTSKGSAQVANFLKHFTKTLQDDRQQSLSQSNLQSVTRRFDNLIAKLSINALNDLRKQSNPDLSILTDIQSKRKEIELKIYQSRQNAINNERLIAQHNRIVHVMAECLTRNNLIQQALQLYEALFDADKIFQLMQIKQEKLKNATGNKNKDALFLQHYVKFMNKARKYHRKQLALKKAQKAYHIAQDTADNEKMTQITNFIKDVCLGVALEQDTYLQVLNNEIVMASISKQVSEKILDVSKNAPKKNK